MGESFVCFCHLVHFVFSLASAACIVQCVQNFACQTVNHCLFAAFSGIQCDPSQTQCLSSFRSDFHGYLVGCTADTASLNLQYRHDVAQSFFKNFQSFSTCFFCYFIECTVNDLFRYTLFTVQHDAVDELCHQLAVVNRIGQDLSFCYMSFSRHDSSLLDE